MKRMLLVVGMLLGALGLARGAATPPFFSNWPTNCDPQSVGLRVVDNYLAHAVWTNKASGFIIYPEVCAAFGAMRFADATDNDALKTRLVRRFDDVWKPATQWLVPAGGHVDRSVFGVVPLEIYLLTGDPGARSLGLAKADAQWDSPQTNGLTRETRWWVDDAYMIGSLQIQAFRATKNAKYADHVALQLSAYLDRLQEPNGLFHHGPEAPFYWGRGNGWVAAALAEVLQSLPSEHPRYARLMAGYQKMMAGLKSVQAPSGLWHQLLDLPESWEETSCTGMFTYAMIVGVRQGWLTEAEYGNVARRGWLALCGKIDATATLHDICVGTNQSKDRQFYLDRPRSAGDLHGQAPVLWCAWALLQK